jgi:hypothetical protein
VFAPIKFTIVLGNFGPGVAVGVSLDDTLTGPCSTSWSPPAIGTLGDQEALVYEFTADTFAEGLCQNTAVLSSSNAGTVSASASSWVGPIGGGAAVGMMGLMQAVNQLETPTPTITPATPTEVNTATLTATLEPDTPTATRAVPDTPTSSEPAQNTPTSTEAALDTPTLAGPATESPTSTDVALVTPGAVGPTLDTPTPPAPSAEPVTETPSVTEVVAPTQEPGLPTEAPVETPSGGEATPEGAAAAGLITGGAPPPAGLVIPLAWLGLILVLWLRADWGTEKVAPGAAAQESEAG